LPSCKSFTAATVWNANGAAVVRADTGDFGGSGEPNTGPLDSSAD
jgi:hypothetical protein